MKRSIPFIRWLQKTWKHYSQWLPCNTTQFEGCCHCGQVHQVQYQLRDDPRKLGRYVLYKRVRVSHVRTKARRRQKRIKGIVT